MAKAMSAHAQRICRLIKDGFCRKDIINHIKSEFIGIALHSISVMTDRYLQLERVKKGSVRGASVISGHTTVAIDFSLKSLPLPELSDIQDSDDFYEWRSGKGEKYLLQICTKLVEQTKAKLMNRPENPTNEAFNQLLKEKESLKTELAEMTEKWNSALREADTLRTQVTILSRHRTLDPSKHIAVDSLSTR